MWKGERVERTRGRGHDSALCRAVLPCDVRVVDEGRREIELCATSEAVDSYGTVFSYEASKDAFGRWAGNVREMHERKAVGRKVALRCDDEARKVFVRVRISKGAGDTWEKVKDGTLSGASIGASNVEWRTQRVGGQEVPVAQRYDLVELSLVDLASNPDAQGVAFVRDAVPDAALLEDVEVEPQSTQSTTQSAQREETSEETQEGTHREDMKGAEVRTIDSASNSASSAVRSGGGEIAERDGTLSTEDPVAAIAAAALARGMADLTPAPGGEPALTGKQARLAALGAPGYARPITEILDKEETKETEDTKERGTSDAENTERAEIRGEAREIMSSPGSSAASALDVGQLHKLRELRVEEPPSWRAQGPYSRNPEGPADAGTPAEVPEDATMDAANGAGNGGGHALDDVDLTQALRAMRELLAALGLVRPMDRDGRPGRTGTAEDAVGRDAQGGQGGREGATSNAEDAEGRREERGNEDSRRRGERREDEVKGFADSRALRDLAVDTSVDRAVEGVYRRLAGQLGDIEARLARIEAQPMPGGPVLRTADKVSPLAPHGGTPGAHEQYRALEALAGRLTDPQAQVAVAAEMIRLQQEAAGIPPAMQVMPRAGRGWGER